MDADFEVLDRALGLCPPQVIGGDFHFAEGIFFGTEILVIWHMQKPLADACGPVPLTTLQVP
jgi:hypothetical protein